MLNYHIISPTNIQRLNAKFQHYLTLGSYQSPFTLPSILSFSRVQFHQPNNIYIELNHQYPYIIPINHFKLNNNLIKQLTILDKTNSHKFQSQDNYPIVFIFVSLTYPNPSISKESVKKGQNIKLEGNMWIYIQKGKLQINDSVGSNQIKNHKVILIYNQDPQQVNMQITALEDTQLIVIKQIQYK